MHIKSLDEAMASLTGLTVEDTAKFINLYENLLVLFTIINGESDTAFGKVKFEQSRFTITEQNKDIPRMLNGKIDDEEVARAIISRVSN